MFQRARFTYIVFYTCFAVLLVLMLARTFFGIEITDEAYYVAEGKTVLEGNLPYAFNNSNAVGMTILMTPFVSLFKWLVPSYEGYFLYMRICFVLCNAGVLLACFHLLKNNINAFYASCGILIMIVANNSSLLNFSYNSISTIMIFAVGVLLFFLQDKNISPKSQRLGFYIAGILSSLAVFAHPAHVTSVLVFMMLLLYLGKIKLLLCYVCGGLSHILMYFGWIVSYSGYTVFKQGLQGFFFSLGSVEKPAPQYVIAKIWGAYAHLWELMLAVLVTAVSVFLIWEIFLRKTWRLGINTVKIFVVNGLYLSLFVACIYILWRVPAGSVMAYLGGAVSLAITLLIVLFPQHKSVWFMGLPGIVFALFEAFGTVTGSPPGRFSHVVPSILALYLISGTSSSNSNVISGAMACKLKRISSIIKLLHVWNINKILSVTVTAIIIACELYSLTYVYRDEDLSALTYQMPHGVYKGIYTTPKRAEDTWDLECYIKGLTESGDYVAFRDNVPVGYLLMNGRACDIRTWDCMQYSYHKNDPAALYRYYERRGIMPDKIIYVDFGRDKHLSLDDENFLYNEFLQKNYVLQSDIKLNDTYKRIVFYRRKDK